MQGGDAQGLLEQAAEVLTFRASPQKNEEAAKQGELHSKVRGSLPKLSIASLPPPSHRASRATRQSITGGQAGGEKQQGDAVLNATERRSTPEKASRPALTPSLAAKEKERRASREDDQVEEVTSDRNFFGNIMDNLVLVSRRLSTAIAVEEVEVNGGGENGSMQQYGAAAAAARKEAGKSPQPNGRVTPSRLSSIGEEEEEEGNGQLAARGRTTATNIVQNV